MGEFPNKATQFTAGTNAVENARKGGKVRTLGKKMAARLRELKKKGLTDETAKSVANMLTDPEYYAGDVLMWLVKEKDNCESTGQTVALANTLISLGRMHHGDKTHNTNTNINVNWNELVDSCVDEPDEVIDVTPQKEEDK